MFGFTIQQILADVEARIRAGKSKMSDALEVRMPAHRFGQRTNPQRNAERKLCRQMGHRQHRMAQKEFRAMQRAAGQGTRTRP